MVKEMATRGRKPFANRKAGFQNPTEEKGVHPTILKQARKTGQLNLSGRSLSTGDDFNPSLTQPLDTDHAKSFCATQLLSRTFIHS